MMKRFNEIRNLYEALLPEWDEEFKKQGEMFFDPYFFNWIPYFSPIEYCVWQDIRHLNVPFYPQFPVLNYFVDFGCPFKKIAIECDGKQWHDKERDKKRDSKLIDAGWVVFRIAGHECVRTVFPEEEEDKEKREAMMENYFMNTSEGIIAAIKHAYFSYNERYENHLRHIGMTLEKHMPIIWRALA